MRELQAGAKRCAPLLSLNLLAMVGYSPRMLHGEKQEAVDELLDALVWMRRKAKKHEAVDDLIDALVRMRRKVKKKVVKGKLVKEKQKKRRKSKR